MYKFSETTIADIISSGFTIDIQIYEESNSNIAASYNPDDIIREITSKEEYQKYKFFISELHSLFENKFGYLVTFDKYSNRHDSISKYFWMKKSYDRGSCVRFPVCIKISDHKFSGDKLRQQEKYIVDKLNKQGDYKPISHQYQSPNSFYKVISVLDEEFTTYSDVYNYILNILSEIDVVVNQVFIDEYMPLVTPSIVTPCCIFSLLHDGHTIQTFNDIDAYILRLLDMDLICRDDLEFTLLTFNNHTQKSGRDVYKTDEYRAYSGIVII